MLDPISKSYDFGIESENRAVKHLVKSGYKILARNYRYLIAEIDIIAFKRKYSCRSAGES